MYVTYTYHTTRLVSGMRKAIKRRHRKRPTCAVTFRCRDVTKSRNLFGNGRETVKGYSEDKETDQKHGMMNKGVVHACS